MAQQACREYGYEVDKEVVDIFTKYRKTHNQGVFDAYTPEMRLARHSAILTGLPDAYGRGRIIGDYRRVALYGVDILIQDKKHQIDTSLVRMTSKNIRLREELAEQVRALEELKKLGDIYDFDAFFREASPVEYDLTYNRLHPSSDIVKGYISAVGRGKRRLPPSEQAFSGIVAHKIVSVNSRIIHLMRRLRHGKQLEYHEIFEACDGKSELVATFLATLELVKGKRVRIEGEGEHAVVRMIEGDRE